MNMSPTAATAATAATAGAEQAQIAGGTGTAGENVRSSKQVSSFRTGPARTVAGPDPPARASTRTGAARTAAGVPEDGGRVVRRAGL